MFCPCTHYTCDPTGLPVGAQIRDEEDEMPQYTRYCDSSRKEDKIPKTCNLDDGTGFGSLADVVNEATDRIAPTEASLCAVPPEAAHSFGGYTPSDPPYYYLVFIYGVFVWATRRCWDPA